MKGVVDFEDNDAVIHLTLLNFTDCEVRPRNRMPSSEI